MFVAATLWLGIASVPVRADLTTFDASATFDNGTLTGTVTIDTTKGVVTAIDLGINVTSPAETLVLTDILSQGQSGPSYEITGVTVLKPFDKLHLFITATSLQGYTGGPLYAPSSVDGTAGELSSGSLTPEVTAVPEPSSAGVGAIGAVAFIAYRWSRHRREQRRQATA
jgi:hypothetical protein